MLVIKIPGDKIFEKVTDTTIFTKIRVVTALWLVGSFRYKHKFARSIYPHRWTVCLSSVLCTYLGRLGKGRHIRTLPVPCGDIYTLAGKIKYSADSEFPPMPWPSASLQVISRLPYMSSNLDTSHLSSFLQQLDWSFSCFLHRKLTYVWYIPIHSYLYVVIESFSFSLLPTHACAKSRRN